MKEMDTIHVDFIKQINALELMYGEELQAGFSNLLQHSIRHFEREDELMQAYAFPQIVEHREQHRKVLAEMTRFAAQLKEGKSIFARAYIRQRLPEWFNLHLTTMDSALAWYLKNHTQRFNTRVRSNYAI
ncbi:MAG: hypothetical protein AUJ56_10030 [Zetaproteobacteria bacterium CG1_02_49_23]|nr:MAG: hypothetical protein AUJ56_10030 [Zetaproteobacteria bacterium CG1_02_49_23]